MIHPQPWPVLPKITLLPTIRKQLRDSIVIASVVQISASRSSEAQYTHGQVQHSTNYNWSKIGSSKIILSWKQQQHGFNYSFVTVFLCCRFIHPHLPWTLKTKNKKTIFTMSVPMMPTQLSHELWQLWMWRPQHRRTLSLVDGIFHPRIIANPHTCAWHFWAVVVGLIC